MVEYRWWHRIEDWFLYHRLNSSLRFIIWNRIYNFVKHSIFRFWYGDGISRIKEN